MDLTNSSLILQGLDFNTIVPDPRFTKACEHPDPELDQFTVLIFICMNSLSPSNFLQSSPREDVSGLVRELSLELWGSWGIPRQMQNQLSQHTGYCCARKETPISGFCLKKFKYYLSGSESERSKTNESDPSSEFKVCTAYAGILQCSDST